MLSDTHSPSTGRMKYIKTAGIICEYNPFHLGHAAHIEKTRRILDQDCGVVCVMSGNFVQRGDFAIFSKHARAMAALRCGADLVVELPSAYALSSAEGFAAAGVYLLDSLGVCDCVSFGSESGDIGKLWEAAEATATAESGALIKEWMGAGLPYASALQKTADCILGEGSGIFKSPNNLLGIEYLKTIKASDSMLKPITVKRIGGAHDGDKGISASALRKLILDGGSPQKNMPRTAAAVYKGEIEAGRGPVTIKAFELAMLSRLRAAEDFSNLAGASEGLDRRFMKYAKSEPTIEAFLEKVKTKRYAMSRLRRMLICACLEITAGDTESPPPYIRVLAMNSVGMRLLKAAQANTALPIITKPAAAQKLPGKAGELFRKEAAATDFYALGYPNENQRAGGQEWTTSPVID